MPSNLTTIPAPRVPLINADTGLISTEWYRFLFNLYTLSGSGSNLVSLDELQLGPPPQPPTTSGGGGGSGTVTSVATGTGLTGGPITTTGTIDFAVAAVGTWAATPSSANLALAMTDETGTGALVFANTPTLVTPILGTPTSGDFSTGTFTWPTFNQNTTGYAAGLAGGLIGSLPYQSAVNTTVFLAAGTNGQVLTLAAGVPSWATPTTGTVTSVSGTGTVNGITLTGTVTSSGSLTLGGTLGGIGNSQLTNSSVTFNGVAVALGASGTITATATNALTIGTGLSGTSYNGSAPVTIANTGVLGVTGTAPVASSGGQNPVISMPAATTTVNGYLTSTDWNTFNNKQPAGTYVNSVSGTAGRITSTGGVTPVIDLASGVATPGTTGSATLIPVVTIDTYGRVTSITTAANPQGTVTSVGGTGTVNGITLTGTVTSSGNLTLGGTLSGVSLTTQVSGTLPIANGGTGQTTASAAFNALSPITTTGDLILGNGTNSATRLGIGLNTYVLTSNGTTASWQAPAAGGSNITPLGMWENNRTISANYTIGSTNSAMSSGPITINSGVVVTVPSGSRWIVL
jgi:trimeric autotransporter adhesin